MNKKVLGLVLTVLFVAVLATPIIGTAMAGKGQEKLYFKLYMEGEGVGNPDRPPWVSEEFVWHSRGGDWAITGDFYVVVDMDTLYPVSYFGELDINFDLTTGQMTIKVRETITFDDGGTLEILSVDKLHNYGTPDMYGGGTFVGHGTGTLKGVKVAGVTVAGEGITREGTVMGWPT